MINRYLPIKTVVVLLLLTVCLTVTPVFVSCGKNISMPSNGDIRFHDIGMRIPVKFIADSTQSCQELYFLYNGSLYAIALRGASDEEFADLIRTVCFDISDTAG